MLPLIIMAASTAMSMAAQQQQASAQADQLNFNSRQSLLDAQIAMQNADIQARALRKYGRQVVGQQRTKRAISGIRLEGTPLEVMADTIENIELDAIAMRRQGSFNAGQNQIMAKYQSGMASQTKTAGTIGMAGTALGGMSNAGMFS